MSRRAATVRWVVRILFLGAAILLAVGGPIPAVLGRVFPGLSPLVGIASTLILRGWFWWGPLWVIGPLAVIVLGFWKGRWFCRWVCPTGTLYALPSRWNAGKRILKRPLGGYVFWIIVAGSLGGAPLLLFLDPLATFNQLTPLLKGILTPASLILTLVIPLMLLLGAIQPMIWCTHLCPLGYLLQFARSVGTLGVEKSFDQSRRGIALGVFVGLPAALISRNLLFPGRTNPDIPMLPPGASDPVTFAATCTRCYACVNVCPGKIIQVRSPFHQRFLELFAPSVEYFYDEANPDLGFCMESCNECSQVCPAGAIAPLTLGEKSQRKIGTAEVVRETCIAWKDHEHCMVCEEYCSYSAIDTDYDESGVPRPVVNKDLCRGCGLCYYACPVHGDEEAVILRGVTQQTHIDDGYAELLGIT